MARALVQMFGGAQGSMLTDGEGRFRFEDIPQSRVMLAARKPGFFSPEELSSPVYTRRFVTVGPDTQAIVLKLIPEALIIGHVNGADGEPVEGTEVKVKRATVVDGRKQFQERGSGRTDDDGSFRIANLPPGSYFVEVRPGWSRAAVVPGADGPQGYRSTYFPGVPDIASAAAVQLQAGEKREVEIAVKAEPLFKITGWITGFIPVQGVGVQVIDQEGEFVPAPFRFERLSDAFGVEGVPSGSYTMLAVAPDKEGHLEMARAPVVVGGNISGLHLTLQPASSIPIVVHREFASNRPAVDREPAYQSVRGGGTVRVYVTVTLKAAGPRASGIYSGVRGGQFTAIGPAAGVIQSTVDGDSENPAQSLQNVPSGPYSVEIRPQGDWYVQSAACGSTDLMREDLVVRAGSQTQPIEIELRNDVATITGTVNAAGNNTPVTVIAIPKRATIAIRVQPASPRGDFQLQGLAPGEYDLFAFDHADGLEYKDPEAMDEYASRAIHVTLQPDEKKTVNLQVIQRGEQ